MTQRRTGGLDWFRLCAALLVAANHTSPLAGLSPAADYVLVQILARLAVPFFLMTSGWFLLPRSRSQGGAALVPFLKKGLVLYGLATLLYLPLQFYKGYRPGMPELLRDIFFGGTFYHLWYFPAMLIGSCLVCALARRLGTRWVLAVCGGLYLIGLGGDSYHALAALLPPLKAFYDVLFLLVDQTRCGLFLAPLFLALGGAAAEHEDGFTLGQNAVGLGLSLALLLAEGTMVGVLDLARYSTMYLALPPAVFFLFRVLSALDVPERPGLRALSTGFYIIHPWCIVLVRGFAKVTGTTGALVENALVHYLAVVLLSAALGGLFMLFKTQLARRGRSQVPAAVPEDRATEPSSPPARCWAEIDLSAIRRNIRVLRGMLPADQALMAVVKADGYGHGAAQVAGACAQEGVGSFAVATVAEGVSLRRSGATGDILVLGRAFPEEFRPAFAHDLILTAADADHARELAACGLPIRLHVAVDTGMARLGFHHEAVEDVRALYAVLRVEGLYSHLCDSGDEAFSQLQKVRFFTLVERLKALGVAPGQLHIQASEGILSGPRLPCTCARPGLALYGYGHPDLTPALTLKCRVAALHDLAPGETAGYERAFTAERPTRLAVLSIGYADGLPRSLSRGRGRVLIGGRSAPIVGLICMDQALADVTGLGEVRPGDEVAAIGPGLGADAVARMAGTIPNELLSRLGERVERRYVPTAAPLSP